MAAEVNIWWFLFLMVMGMGGSAAIGMILDFRYDLEPRSWYWGLGALGPIPIIWYLLTLVGGV